MSDNFKNILSSSKSSQIKQPKWIKPMLATLTKDYFSDKNWLFERKLDGERVLAIKNKKKVTLYTRNKKIINNTYPEIVNILSEQNQDNIIVDGEIVAFDKNVTSFSKLQGRIQIKDPKKALKTEINVYYYVFDVLYIDKYDLRKVPLKDRKKILKNALKFRDVLRYTSHRNTHGEKYLKQACKKGWEGLIAKKSNSIYVSKRSRDWLKFKCVNEQELVIGGYTDPQGNRKGFGALLLGYYKNKKLQYAGQVGTGFNDDLLDELRKQLDKLETDSSFFTEKIPKKGVHWVKPKLVCEVGFTEWTSSGKLRHPRFLGLRRDKPAKKVVKET